MRASLTASGAFTFLETLISMLILSIVLAALAPVVGKSISGLAATTERSIALSAIADLNASFRDLCGRTAQFPWEPSSRLAAADTARSAWTVYFLDGDPERAWRLEKTANGISLIEGARHISVPAGSIEYAPFLDGDRVVGMSLRFTALGTTWMWRERFASSGF